MAAGAPTESREYKMKKKKRAKRTGSERGRLLNRARRAVGLTRPALAAKLDVTGAAVSAWESGSRMPSDSLIPKYAAAVNLTPHQLLDILEKP
jgi:transcriptional regulator with XRE-family HTH domain